MPAVRQKVRGSLKYAANERLDRGRKNRRRARRSSMRARRDYQEGNPLKKAVDLSSGFLLSKMLLATR